MRFSIISLFGLVAVAAVGFAALANPSKLWASLISSTALFLLGVALLGALMLRGRGRAFCCGFAMFGFGYQLLTYGQVPLLGTHQSQMLPFFLIERLRDIRYPGGSNYWFSTCGDWLCVIALAAVGGLIGCCFHSRRDRGSGKATADSRGEVGSNGP